MYGFDDLYKEIYNEGVEKGKIVAKAECYDGWGADDWFVKGYAKGYAKTYAECYAEERARGYEEGHLKGRAEEQAILYRKLLIMYLRQGMSPQEILPVLRMTFDSLGITRYQTEKHKMSTIA